MKTSEYVTYEVLNKALSELQEYMNLKHDRDRRLDDRMRVRVYKESAWHAGLVLAGLEVASAATWLFSVLDGGSAEGFAYTTAFLFWMLTAVTVAYVMLRSQLERMDANFIAWAKVYLSGTDLWVDSDDAKFEVDSETEK